MLKENNQKHYKLFFEACSISLQGLNQKTCGGVGAPHAPTRSGVNIWYKPTMVAFCQNNEAMQATCCRGSKCTHHQIVLKQITVSILALAYCWTCPESKRIRNLIFMYSIYILYIYRISMNLISHYIYIYIFIIHYLCTI